MFLFAAGAALAQVPANNEFAAATPVTAGVPIAGTNVNATVEAGEPPTHWTLTFAAGAATGRSVWYSYTPAASGLAAFSVVASGTGTAAAAMYGAAYSGSALNALTRIASASSTAGAAGPPATAGTAFPSNLFAVAAGVPVFIQITGVSATGAAPFSLTVTPYTRNGTVVLPRYSNWEWLHTTNGFDPTTDATWATTWKNTGDPTDYDPAAAIVSFSAPLPAPLGFAALDGAPGVKTDIGTAAAGANNNAAYARATFTLPADTTNLWAEVVADDGAYIYIDGHPGVPVHIAARLADNSTTNNTGFYDYRPQDDVFITGAIPAVAAGPVPGCRAYLPAGFSPERHTKMVFLGGMVGQLSAGSHQIAVSLHQTANNSSDLAFDLQLIDMGAWPLASGSAGIVFTDVPVAFASGTVAAVPALEHHYAPNAGQADLAWYCVAPASSLAQGCVVPDTTAGLQKALRLNAASEQRFVTEPVNVDGLPQFVASLRILTNDTSSGFEAGDGFRVFLETSADGVNFAEPAPPLELQPQVNGAAALDPFRAGFVTNSVPVTPNPHKFVRMVITGGVDSGSEYIYFDDIRFSQCQLFASTANLIYDNKGNNDRADDTVSFDLTVTASGNTSPTWTTSGFGAGNEVSGTFGGAAIPITRPAADVAGVRQNVVFTVSEDGNPVCSANVTVTTPVAAIGNIQLTNAVRSPGADLSTTADDSFTYTVLVDGTATGVDYEIRSSDTGNTVLYGTGVYSVAGTLTVPATLASLTIRDNSAPTVLKIATLPPVGADLAMGRTILGGVNRILYSNPAATAALSEWRQTSGTGITPPPVDLGLTVDETTTMLHPGVNLAADAGVVESPMVGLTGLSNVTVSMSLRAFENSVGSGFEVDDTFLIEIIEERAAGETPLNLIAGHPADVAPADGMLNGFTGTAAQYDKSPASDEFNAAAVNSAGSSRGTFQFSYAVPGDVLRLRVKITGANDSPNEYFFLQHLIITDVTDPDDDGDGLSDAWEITHFGNRDQLATGDPDGDGQTNAAEFAAGTVPIDGVSALKITAVSKVSNFVFLTFASVSGKSYRAQSSADLTAWEDVGAVVTATGASTTIAGLPAGVAPRHFRIRLVP